MPGSLANAAPVSVMPTSLCTAFTWSQEYPLRSNQYRDGSFQASVQAISSRKRWQLAKRLPPTLLQELRNFYDARNGKMEPFYFYDPYDTTPKFAYDPTGVATAGRYTVRFDMDWSQSSGPGRSDVAVNLIEVA